jgi:AcrR family transcriptional regulator
MGAPTRARDAEHEANRLAALTASLGRRRLAVTARLERAALELFVERGLDGVSVDDIAAGAGISRRTFYRYFESPADIVGTVFSRAMDGWTQLVGKRPVAEPLLTSFRFADEETLAVPDDAEMLRLALAVMRRSPEAWARVSGPMMARTASAYREIVERRLAVKGQDTTTAGPIAAGLTAIMVHLAERSAREGKVLEPQEFEDALRAFQSMIAE